MAGNHSDWLSLVESSGLVVSQPVLEEAFPDGLPSLSGGQHRWLKRKAETFFLAASSSDRSKANNAAREWIRHILEVTLELHHGYWRFGGELPQRYQIDLPEFSQGIAPTGVLFYPSGPRKDEAALLLCTVNVDQELDRRDGTQGRWKASPTTKLERLLRETGVPLGLVTNGREFRLLSALPGLSTGWLTWSERLLVEEKPTLDAFCALLGKSTLLAERPENTLAHLCDLSVHRQGEVADQLGAQVRSGLALLLEQLDLCDRQSGGELLRGLPDEQLYEACVVVMMRLVFMLYAEERSLLPHGQVMYDRHYGLTWLWHQLALEQRLDPVRMESTQEAWKRLLAAFRLVFHGSTHPDLVLRAYGGDLFRPDRFPFLESSLCKIPNSVVHQILRLLLFARSRGGDAQRVGYWALSVEQIGYMYEGLLEYCCGRSQDGSGSRTLALGTSRRASGAHYTPQHLTERVVRTTLEPLVYRCQPGKPGRYVEPKSVKSASELLDLKVCDPAMGSGAFLVQVVRYLADRLVEAWDLAIAANPGVQLTMPYAAPSQGQVGELLLQADHRQEMELWARRYVVERCIYGVDKNPLAVEMAKLSLWLTTLFKDRPFSFVDHALRAGDSLAGVDEEQLRSWSIDRKGKGAVLLWNFKERIERALAGRRGLGDEPVLDVQDSQRKAQILSAAREELAPFRTMSDLLIAPSFDPTLSASKRETARAKAAELLSVRQEQLDWSALAAHADSMLAEEHGHRPTFHWFLEFPEVFLDGRGGFDAVVGNPPYLGGQFMRSRLGDAYVPFIREFWPEATGTCDIVALFFRRAFDMLRAGGVLGLVSTNTIAQGDTRQGGLEPIVAAGGVIFNAVPRMPWPGQASVNASLVHVSRGAWAGKALLDERPVISISALLDDEVLDWRPRALVNNSGKSFQGSNILGMGFTMPPDEAAAWIEKDPRNKDVLFPYLNGEDLNSSPTQSPSRWVINFFDWPLEKCRDYPDLLRIVEEKVKPQRLAISGNDSTAKQRREIWWRFTRPTMDLYAAIAGLERVLLMSRVSKYHCQEFGSGCTVWSEQVVVFATDRAAQLSVIQSSIHEAWAARLRSSMRTDPRYTPSDCFDTFPFPRLTVEQEADLERVGESYHEHRRQVMLASGLGLTATYNRFHDPECADAGVVALRELHVEVDRAVRDAYGWSDLDLGHGWVATVSKEEKKDRKSGMFRTVEKTTWRYAISEEARKEILSRLLTLNKERYEEEQREAAAAKAAAAKEAAEAAAAKAKRGPSTKPAGLPGRRLL